MLSSRREHLGRSWEPFSGWSESAGFQPLTPCSINTAVSLVSRVIASSCVLFSPLSHNLSFRAEQAESSFSASSSVVSGCGGVLLTC